MTKSCIPHHPVPTDPPQVLLHKEAQTILPLDAQSADLFSQQAVVSGCNGGMSQTSEVILRRLTASIHSGRVFVLNES